MKVWMAPFLFPITMVAAVVLISLGGVLGQLFAGLLAFVIVPHVAVYVRKHSRAFGGPRTAEDDTNYWRIKRII